jgi:hypothetical protein
VARVAAPPGPIRPTTQLTPEEEARAAELEAQIVAEERAAEQQIRRNRERGRERSREDVVAAGRPRELPPLAVRASEEYAYVRRDVLRIVRVGGSLLLVLALLYVLIDVTHVIRI